MKRFISLLVTTLLLISASLPIFVAHADTINLLANPSVETVSGDSPADWTPDTWGTSTTTLALTSDAHTGNEALNVTTASRTDGDAKWMPTPVTVENGQTYTYSDYSKATVTTQLIAAYTNASNVTSYYYLKDVQPSSNWQTNSVDFTVPAGQQKVAILHLLSTAGSLTTDDFSITTKQAVVVPPPTSGNLIANPSMETTDGSNPADWQTDNWGTNTSSFSYLTNDGHADTSSAKIQVTSYTDGDAKWYFAPVSVQPNTSYAFSDYYKATIATSLVVRFDDGSGNYTYKDIAAPAAANNWTQVAASFTTPSTAKYATVLHLIAGVGSLQTDDASLTTTATQSNPTVSIAAPQAGATLAGNVQITATASGDVASSMQLQLDGVNLGGPMTSIPYQFNWDTTTANNGTHNLTAIMTPVTGSPVTSTAVQVIVNNATVGGNLYPNPSLETVNTSNKKLPVDWKNGSWGTNTATFTYPSSGHTGTRSVKTQITSYTNGAAYWYSDPMPVTGNSLYDFRDYYKANIPSEIDAAVIMADGSEQDIYLGTAFASPSSWTKFETQFTIPAGAVSISFYHDIYSVGYVTTDDFSLTPFAYQGFNRALVSITDDDGFAGFYTNGLPVLQKYGLPSTAYIISSYVNNASGYLSLSQLKGLYNAGVEIGSHSVTHPDLSTLNATKQNNELKNSQTALQSWLGVPITDYAAPYGAYNQQIVTDAQTYYQTYRGVQSGYNARNNFDPMNLQVQNIVDTTTVADIQAWLQEAATTNTWLVLVYHQIDYSADDAEYNTYPADFDAQMAAVKASGLTVKTVSDAMAEIAPQL